MNELLGIAAGVGFVLWLSGGFRWLAMAASFVGKEASGESRRLLCLRAKLGLLRWMAKEIGKTEREIAVRK